MRKQHPVRRGGEGILTGCCASHGGRSLAGRQVHTVHYDDSILTIITEMCVPGSVSQYLKPQAANLLNTRLMQSKKSLFFLVIVFYSSTLLTPPI